MQGRVRWANVVWSASTPWLQAHHPAELAFMQNIRNSSEWNNGLSSSSLAGSCGIMIIIQDKRYPNLQAYSETVAGRPRILNVTDAKESLQLLGMGKTEPEEGKVNLKVFVG
jgi:hypothetical protein